MASALLPVVRRTSAGRRGFGHSLRQDALDPGFMTLKLARRTRIMVLMVLVGHESNFGEHIARSQPIS